MDLTYLVNRLKHEGHDVIGLVGGEPDYDTAEPVKAAGIGAITRNVTRYPPGNGVLALREAIAGRLRQDKGLDVNSDQVLVSCGTKPLLHAALLACTDPGDELIVPAPHWISYPEMARLSGLTPVIVPSRADNGFRLTAAELDAALTPKTRAIVLNSPCNPSGAIYDRSLLNELAEVLRQRPDVWVLTDEIYDTIVYTPAPAPSFAALAPDLACRTITINGFSKGYAMAGWRLGYAAGAREMIAAMADIVNHIVGPTSGIVQLAGLEALTGDRTYLDAHCDEYRERRDFAVAAVNAMPGLSCKAPDGAFFLWGDCSGVLGKVNPDGTVLNTEADFVRAAARAGVMFMPGAAFGLSPYFRISYSVDPALLREAMRRLGEFVRALS